MFCTEIDIDNILTDFINKQVNSFQSISEQKKKTNGIFFTNCTRTIDLLLDCLPKNETLFNQTILDPCCGEGIFLLSIILKAYAINPEDKIIKNFIENNLYFIDIDLTMINKTRDNICHLYKILFNQEFQGKLNYYYTDFTLLKRDLFSGLSEIFNIYNSCDYVIGNPPYISLYGRRDQKKNESQRQFYLENYQQFPPHVKNGKINYVMLFIEQGINFLKKDGILSFIVDIAFFETAYQYCRQYLVQNYKIEKLVYNLKVFAHVTSGQIVIEIKKNKPLLNHKINLIDNETNKTSFIAQSNWNNSQDEYKFRLPNSSNLTGIFNKIFGKQDKTLKDIYPNKNLRTCAMLLNMEDKFIGNKIDCENNEFKIYPYYRGSASIKYKYSIPIYDRFFCYNKNLQDEINNQLKEELTNLGIKNKKRIGLGETVVYDNPKVYIRQSAKQLIATFDQNPSSANNSLYVFTVRNNSPESVFLLKYLCGLINSTIYTFFAQQRRIIRYAKGKQPQIKIADLYQIFIPNNYDLQRQIVQLVDLIYENISMKETYIHDIDQLLFNYYELTNEEIKLIKKSIESF